MYSKNGVHLCEAHPRVIDIDPSISTISQPLSPLSTSHPLTATRTRAQRWIGSWVTRCHSNRCLLALGPGTACCLHFIALSPFLPASSLHSSLFLLLFLCSLYIDLMLRKKRVEKCRWWYLSECTWKKVSPTWCAILGDCWDYKKKKAMTGV